MSRYKEKAGTVDLKICLKCSEDREHLTDELLELRNEFGMEISDGDVFSWRCVDCNRDETISDKATLDLLM